ncbi:relaxase/mobilization nuclease domain-containing protein, partial [Parabacteroides sp. OttesenSCG-928-G07]|nr:relaxase/mobilization nuclease domain-containing protein [Parabacteroides sp. OttesenSCG-928-G07]
SLKLLTKSKTCSMIAKNIKGKSFKGCVSYVMNENATMLEAEGVWAATKEDIIRSFAMQRSGRKEIKQPVGHIPIAFSPEDKHRITDDFMVQLAKEYMQEMGIGNTQYIIVRHHNTENPHLHIVYNRINNDLKLISVNHDYKRNIKVCKKLKDKYGLTYGKDKGKVKREKLKNPDKVKYYIHDAIKSVLPSCKNPADLRFTLEKHGVEIDYKFKRGSNEIQGVSFKHENIAFKGSEVDRKYSFGNLKKEFQKNLLEENKRIEETYLRQQAEQKTKQEGEEKESAVKRNIIVKGVELSDEQEKTLKDGGHIFLKNMTAKDGKTLLSAYIFLDDEKKRVLLSYDNPDEFVKYGKYEMRVRDKILVENGYVTRAKVKWWGMGSYANPYLWKENKSDTEYKESWSDPRLPKAPKEELKPKQPIVQQKNRGQKR